MKNPSRLKFLTILVCLGLLAGVGVSFELWFPLSRTFPRTPLFFELPEKAFPPLERMLAAALVIALTLSIIFPLRRAAVSLAALWLALLVFLDQMRLQPWVYQYLLLLAIFVLHERETKDEDALRQTLGFGQLLVAGLYFWSGVQKFNFAFSHETLPFLLGAAENPPTLQSPHLFWLGSSVALFETLIGVGLVFRQTRRAAVISAIGLHLSILILLIAKNHNSIVWIWNAALIPIVVVLFWRSEISLAEVFTKRRAARSAKAAKAIVAASLLMPALSFFGWWDMYLSGALFSGNTATAVIRISAEDLEKLPPQARQTVFPAKNGDGQYLPLFEWAMAEMNVPVYPEERVFKRAARRICEATTDNSRIELIVRERPAIFAGRSRITRSGCAQAKK